MKTVVGLYERFEKAQQVVRALEDAGFHKEDISMIASDQGGKYAKDLNKGEGQDISDGTAKGAGIGAVLGGLGGLLVGLGALAIPGIGPVLAAGPIVSALAGAGVGAVAGGIVGALVDLGIPEEHAHYYAEGIKRGGTLVLVRTEDNLAGQATAIMNRFDPVDVTDRSNRWESERQQSVMPVTGTDERDFVDEDRSNIPVTGTNQDITIPVVEEDINIGKRQVDKGGVRIETYTEDIPVEEDVHLRQEHVTVERRPVDRQVRPEDMNAFQEGEFEIRETGEEPVVQKNARVVEEVHVNKDVDEVKQTIRDSVQRKDVNVTPIDRNFDQFDSDFRQNYFSSYGMSGKSYEYYQPAYRFGYQLANNPDFQGGEWSIYEPRARSEWQRQGLSGRWEDFRDAVHYAWERGRLRR